MLKRHADLMEKLTAGALLVGMFQRQLEAVIFGLVCYAFWRFLLQTATKKGE